MWKWTPLLVLLLAFGTQSCGPEEGERRSDNAFWDSGPPPILRFEGEEVFWKGDWVNDGPVTYYDKTGRVIGKGYFKLGLEDGDWTLEESGLIAEGKFSQGERDGDWVYRYASDQIQEQGAYRGGKRHGEWRTYYSNGALESVKRYDEGQLVGGVQSFDPEGNEL